MRLENLKIDDDLVKLVQSDRQLAIAVQEKLIELKLLVSPADGQFGKNSSLALEQFQQLTANSKSLATRLLATEFIPPPKLDLNKNDFAAKIIKYMVQQKYLIEVLPGQLNIVYIEGIDSDGTVNADIMNEWNDLRLVLRIENGVPKIISSWPATTEPGWKYTLNPLNPEGAFRIAFGQYRAWHVGCHKNHEALVQCGEITGYRDRNKDGFRTGDPMVQGDNFGVDQHWGGNSPHVDGWSAGCLVGQSIEGHQEFMKIVKSDLRYQVNNSYVFLTTIIDGSKLS